MKAAFVKISGSGPIIQTKAAILSKEGSAWTPNHNVRIMKAAYVTNGNMLETMIARASGPLRQISGYVNRLCIQSPAKNQSVIDVTTPAPITAKIKRAQCILGVNLISRHDSEAMKKDDGQTMVASDVAVPVETVRQDQEFRSPLTISGRGAHRA
jgi:hypothetical protein